MLKSLFLVAFLLYSIIVNGVGFEMTPGLGSRSILYRYRDMKLDIVLDFGYRNMT